MVKKCIFSHIDGRQYAKSQNLKFLEKTEHVTRYPLQ
jgi:hypothetical protein